METVCGRGAFSGNGYDIDQVTAGRLSLSDYVAEQIVLGFSKAADRFIATALADALDESGYLRIDIVGLAHNLGIETAEIGRILGVLQGFDPPGLLRAICVNALQSSCVSRTASIRRWKP